MPHEVRTSKHHTSFTSHTLHTGFLSLIAVSLGAIIHSWQQSGGIYHLPPTLIASLLIFQHFLPQFYSYFIRIEYNALSVTLSAFLGGLPLILGILTALGSIVSIILINTLGHNESRLLSTIFFIFYYIITILGVCSLPWTFYESISYLFHRVAFPGSYLAPIEYTNHRNSLHWLRTPHGDMIPFTLIKTPVTQHPLATVIYSHPNATSLIKQYFSLSYLAINAKVDVIIYEYPGYGLATGNCFDATVEQRLLSALESIYTVICYDGQAPPASTSVSNSNNNGNTVLNPKITAQQRDFKQLYSCVNNYVYISNNYTCFTAQESLLLYIKQQEQILLRKIQHLKNHKIKATMKNLSKTLHKTDTHPYHAVNMSIPPEHEEIDPQQNNSSEFCIDINANHDTFPDMQVEYNVNNSQFDSVSRNQRKESFLAPLPNFSPEGTPSQLNSSNALIGANTHNINITISETPLYHSNIPIKPQNTSQTLTLPRLDSTSNPINDSTTVQLSDTDVIKSLNNPSPTVGEIQLASSHLINPVSVNNNVDTNNGLVFTNDYDPSRLSCDPNGNPPKCDLNLEQTPNIKNNNSGIEIENPHAENSNAENPQFQHLSPPDSLKIDKFDKDVRTQTMFMKTSSFSSQCKGSSRYEGDPAQGLDTPPNNGHSRLPQQRSASIKPHHSVLARGRGGVDMGVGDCNEGHDVFFHSARHQPLTTPSKSAAPPPASSRLRDTSLKLDIGQDSTDEDVASEYCAANQPSAIRPIVLQDDCLTPLNAIQTPYTFNDPNAVEMACLESINTPKYTPQKDIGNSQSNILRNKTMLQSDMLASFQLSTSASLQNNSGSFAANFANASMNNNSRFETTPIHFPNRTFSATPSKAIFTFDQDTYYHNTSQHLRQVNESVHLNSHQNTGNNPSSGVPVSAGLAVNELKPSDGVYPASQSNPNNTGNSENCLSPQQQQELAKKFNINNYDLSPEEYTTVYTEFVQNIKAFKTFLYQQLHFVKLPEDKGFDENLYEFEEQTIDDIDQAYATGKNDYNEGGIYFNYAQTTIGIRSKRIILQGRSLGTGISSIVAANICRKQQHLQNKQILTKIQLELYNNPQSQQFLAKHPHLQHQQPYIDYYEPQCHDYGVNIQIRVNDNTSPPSQSSDAPSSALTPTRTQMAHPQPFSQQNPNNHNSNQINIQNPTNINSLDHLSTTSQPKQPSDCPKSAAYTSYPVSTAKTPPTPSKGPRDSIAAFHQSSSLPPQRLIKLSPSGASNSLKFTNSLLQNTRIIPPPNGTNPGTPHSSEFVPYNVQSHDILINNTSNLTPSDSGRNNPSDSESVNGFDVDLHGGDHHKNQNPPIFKSTSSLDIPSNLSLSRQNKPQTGITIAPGVHRSTASDRNQHQDFRLTHNISFDNLTDNIFVNIPNNYLDTLSATAHPTNLSSSSAINQNTYTKQNLTPEHSPDIPQKGHYYTLEDDIRMAISIFSTIPEPLFTSGLRIPVLLDTKCQTNGTNSYHNNTHYTFNIATCASINANESLKFHTNLLTTRNSELSPQLGTVTTGGTNTHQPMSSNAALSTISTISHTNLSTTTHLLQTLQTGAGFITTRRTNPATFTMQSGPFVHLLGLILESPYASLVSTHGILESLLIAITFLYTYCVRFICCNRHDTRACAVYNIIPTLTESDTLYHIEHCANTINSLPSKAPQHLSNFQLKKSIYNSIIQSKFDILRTKHVISEVFVPTLYAHGLVDNVVPMANSQKLHSLQKALLLFKYHLYDDFIAFINGEKQVEQNDDKYDDSLTPDINLYEQSLEKHFSYFKIDIAGHDKYMPKYYLYNINNFMPSALAAAEEARELSSKIEPGLLDSPLKSPSDKLGTPSTKIVQFLNPLPSTTNASITQTNNIKRHPFAQQSNQSTITYVDDGKSPQKHDKSQATEEILTEKYYQNQVSSQYMALLRNFVSYTNTFYNDNFTIHPPIPMNAGDPGRQGQFTKKSSNLTNFTLHSSERSTPSSVNLTGVDYFYHTFGNKNAKNRQTHQPHYFQPNIHSSILWHDYFNCPQAPAKEHLQPTQPKQKLQTSTTVAAGDPATTSDKNLQRLVPNSTSVVSHTTQNANQIHNLYIPLSTIPMLDIHTMYASVASTWNIPQSQTIQIKLATQLAEHKNQQKNFVARNFSPR